MAYGYSLDMLPVAGLTDIVQDVETAQLRLTATLEILDGVRNMPAGLSQMLQQALANVRFHVIAGLSFIDAFLRTGHNIWQQSMDVEGLKDAVDLHLQALTVAKPLWTKWLADAQAQGTPAEQLPAPSSPVVIGQTNAVAASIFDDPLAVVQGPSDLNDYVMIGIVGLLGLGLLKLLK
jgi:hypothetical protein